jgi:hypothetical protein
MVRPVKVRPFYTWGLSLAGVAAAVVAVVLLRGKPETISIPVLPQNDNIDLIQQIAFISNFNPADADSLEFRPVGDGYILTAHFSDGQNASYMLTPLDGGKSFNLVALKQ